jgi:hypothetical protein
MPNERIFGSGPLQWCKKVSFFDLVIQRQIAFRMGDFIEHYQGAIARIDQMFVHTHDVDGKRRLFMKVSVVDTDDTVRIDNVLDVPVVRLAPANTVLQVWGFRSVMPSKKYLLPVDIDEEGNMQYNAAGEQLLLIPWRVDLL